MALTDDDIRTLAQHSPHLEGLGLARCPALTNASTQHIANAVFVENLIYLDLSGMEYLTFYRY